MQTIMSLAGNYFGNHAICSGRVGNYYWHRHLPVAVVGGFIISPMIRSNSHPEKLAQMKLLWDEYARENGVILPSQVSGY